jgi:hypothetical protein
MQHYFKSGCSALFSSQEIEHGVLAMFCSLLASIGISLNDECKDRGCAAAVWRCVTSPTENGFLLPFYAKFLAITSKTGKTTHLNEIVCCSIEFLRAECDQEGYIRVGSDPKGFPVVLLQHESGSEALIHLHGGVVCSWTDKDGMEMLHLDPRNDFNPLQPIKCDR